jgi:hypothetical protein
MLFKVFCRLSTVTEFRNRICYGLSSYLPAWFKSGSAQQIGFGSGRNFFYTKNILFSLILYYCNGKFAILLNSRRFHFLVWMSFDPDPHWIRIQILADPDPDVCRELCWIRISQKKDGNPKTLLHNVRSLPSSRVLHFYPMGGLV